MIVVRNINPDLKLLLCFRGNISGDLFEILIFSAGLGEMNNKTINCNYH